MTHQDIGQAIKEMSEIEFPSGLHGRIMRQLLFLKFRTPFVVVVTLLVLNLVLSGTRVWGMLAEVEAATVVSILWSSIEWSVGGLGQFAADLYELVPVGQVGLLVFNIAALFYIAFYLPRVWARMGSRS